MQENRFSIAYPRRKRKSKLACLETIQGYAAPTQGKESPHMNYVHRQFQDGEIIAGTRYRVLGLLGIGGMGAVYDVEHTELGKRFVLKALHQNLSTQSELVARLKNEWRALGRLDHPNIVNVTDAGNAADGSAYYVMERLEGETLAARMARVGRHSMPQAIGIAEGILNALAAAHDIGVIHRDVKPPNVFVLKDGSIKLLDFGIAKVAESEIGPITMRGIAIGTPRYMAPEQARGDVVDSRADLYATGLIIFELLTGKSPFEGARDANELLLAQLTKEAPALGSLVPGVPPELEQLVQSLLAKEADKRPATAHQVLQRLERILANQARTSGLSLQVSPLGIKALTPASLQRLAESATVYQDVAPARSLGSQRPAATQPLPAGESFRPPGADSRRNSAPPTRTHTPLQLSASLGTLASNAVASQPPQFTPPPLSSTLATGTARAQRARGWMLGVAIGTGSAVAAFAVVMLSGVLSKPNTSEPAAAAPQVRIATPVRVTAQTETPPAPSIAPALPPSSTPTEAIPALPGTSAHTHTAPNRKSATARPDAVPPQQPARAEEAPAPLTPKKQRSRNESMSQESGTPSRSKLPVSGL